MDGTEIGNALHAAHAAVQGSEPAEIFLVTDEEVRDRDAVVQDAKRARPRIFAVGVGSAVSGVFVRGLAAGTGGERELVSPREDMSSGSFGTSSACEHRARRVAVRRPDGAQDVVPAELGSVFESDTVVACARFDDASINGIVVLEIETEKGDVMGQDLPISMTPLSGAEDRLSPVARVAASAWLKESNRRAGLLDDTAPTYRPGSLHPGGAGAHRGECLGTALPCGLVSPWTNWLVIAERPEEEKAQHLPMLRKVPQTLAAGWDGAGVVDDIRAARDARLCLHEEPFDAGYSDSYCAGCFDASLVRLILLEGGPTRLDEIARLDLLREAGVGSEFDDLLRTATDLGLNVDVIVAIVLAGLLDGPLAKHLSRIAQGNRSLSQGAMAEPFGPGSQLCRPDGRPASSVLAPETGFFEDGAAGSGTNR